ncbi:MAG: hypothetical protein WCY47_00960 [Pusillimonas sp.]
MKHTRYSIQCCDDTGEIPASIEHLPPLLLNPDAHPLVLLSAASARARRIKYTLEPYLMMSPADADLDSSSIHRFLMTLYHQSDELSQMLSGCIDCLDDQKVRDSHT